MSFVTSTARAVAAMQRGNPELCRKVRLTFEDGQKWDGNVVRQSLTHGLQTADGQIIGDAACVLDLTPIAGVDSAKLQGANAALLGDGDAKTALRVLIVVELAGGALWRLTCGPESRQT